MVKVNVEKTLEKVELHPDLAVSLDPSEVKAGIFASTLSAQLFVQDNKTTLLPVDVSAWNRPSTASVTAVVTGAKKRKMKIEPDSSRSSSTPPLKLRRPCPPPAKRVYGNLDLAAFVGLLRQQGGENISVSVYVSVRLPVTEHFSL